MPSRFMNLGYSEIFYAAAMSTSVSTKAPTRRLLTKRSHARILE